MCPRSRDKYCSAKYHFVGCSERHNMAVINALRKAKLFDKYGDFHGQICVKSRDRTNDGLFCTENGKIESCHLAVKGTWSDWKSSGKCSRYGFKGGYFVGDQRPNVIQIIYDH